MTGWRGCLRPLVLSWFAGRSVCAHCPAQPATICRKAGLGACAQPAGVRTEVSAAPILSVGSPIKLLGASEPGAVFTSPPVAWHCQPGDDGEDRIVSAHRLGKGTRDGVEAVCASGSSAGATEICASGHLVTCMEEGTLGMFPLWIWEGW